MKMFYSLLFVLCTTISAQENPEVVTQLGTIIGRVEQTPVGLNVETFKGIPYAAPPIGSGRFANPEPYGAFPGGVWSADSFGSSCLQGPPASPLDEDCLFLNIWRPDTLNENRAVMVWIHGGGFTTGSTSQDDYDGGVLSVFGDVVIVTINYRLGIFGFFHTGDDRMPNGNQGLLDQQLALQWVQDNIEAFGGDPNQVTIFGESAGASSVNHHLLMPGSDELFTRGIMQSGDSTAFWAIQSLGTVSVAAQFFSEQTGCANDDTFVDCLREIPAETLRELTVAPQDVPLYAVYSPVVDGVTIPDKPLDMMQSGQMHRKDIILGFNKDEGSSFIYMFPTVTPISVIQDPIGAYTSVVEAYLGPYRNLTEDGRIAVLDAYVPLDENESFKGQISISDMLGDAVFVCSLQQVARAFTQYDMTVYQYYLTHRASTSRLPSWYGVAHFDDVQWVFGRPLNDDFGYEEVEKDLTMEVMTKWTDFAKFGNPGSEWPAYSSENGAAYVEIRAPNDLVYVTGEDVRGEFCDLWNF